MDPIVPEVIAGPSTTSVPRPFLIQEIIGVVIIILVAVTTFVFIYPPTGTVIEETISAAMLPEALKTVRFAPARFASAPTAVYTRDVWSYSKSYYDGHIVSVSQGRPEVVVTEGSDGLYRVFVSSVSVLASERPILGAALSPNKEIVAVTRQSNKNPDTRSARDYDVVLIFPATGKEISMGNGFAPIFVDDSTLMWTSPLGIHTRNIVTGETNLRVKHTFSSVVSSVTYSPDRTLVAWSDLAGSSTDVFSIQTGEKVASFASVLPLIALSNTGLFSLTPQVWMTIVTHYSFDGADSRMIHWLPGNFQISKLTL